MKKNPYELRFEIYQAAETRLQKRYEDEIEEYRLNLSLSMSKDSDLTHLDFDRPIFPSLEEVFEEASMIKSFVENKD